MYEITGTREEIIKQLKSLWGVQKDDILKCKITYACTLTIQEASHD